MQHLITIGERTFQLHYGSNAMRALEKETGRTTQVLAFLLVSHQTGLGMLQEILWAGIEGARLRYKLILQPAMSVEDVGDLIDEHPGGPATLWAADGPAVKTLLAAWSEAFNVKDRPDIPKGASPDPTTAETSQTPAPPNGGTS